MAGDMGGNLDYNTEDVEDFEDFEDFDTLEELEDDMDDDEAFFEDDLDDDEDFVEDDLDDDEVYSEYDMDGDEAFDEDDIDDDEMFEYDDDDDEEAELADESYDEDDDDLDDEGEGSLVAPELTRRQRRARALRIRRIRRLRARRRAMALRRRRIAARRRAINLRRANQRRLRNVLPLGRVRFRRIRPMKGSGVVTARLPNGRSTKMMFSPPLATRSDIARMSRQISANDAKQAKAFRSQSKAIVKLRSAQGAAVKSLTAQQAKSTSDLTKRIASGDAKLNSRISKESASHKSALGKHKRYMSRELRSQQNRQLLNTATVASSLPMFASYGVKSDPFAKNNLIMAGSTLGWTFADELAGRFLVRGRKARSWRRGLNILSYAAPIGNLATIWFLMKDKQHERFVTGIHTHGGGAQSTVSVKVADKLQDAFTNASNLPVLATASSGDVGTLDAKLDKGEITFTIADHAGANIGNAVIAWAVDLNSIMSKQ